MFTVERLLFSTSGSIRWCCIPYPRPSALGVQDGVEGFDSQIAVKMIEQVVLGQRTCSVRHARAACATHVQRARMMGAQMGRACFCETCETYARAPAEAALSCFETLLPSAPLTKRTRLKPRTHRHPEPHRRPATRKWHSPSATIRASQPTVTSATLGRAFGAASDSK
eukprot:257091-Pleurochrysis_carterae.AAC.13